MWQVYTHRSEYQQLKPCLVTQYIWTGICFRDQQKNQKAQLSTSVILQKPNKKIIEVAQRGQYETDRFHIAHRGESQ